MQYDNCVEQPVEACKETGNFGKEAEIKAFRLLGEHISEEGILHLLAFGYFEIIGIAGIYRIEMDERVTLCGEAAIHSKIRPLRWNLCVSAKDKHLFPKGDRLLALYLSIKNNEKEFIETANFRSVDTDDEYTNDRELRIPAQAIINGPSQRYR